MFPFIATVVQKEKQKQKTDSIRIRPNYQK
jgi:hypothetical protein